MSKKHVYRRGDKVRILRPRVVVRVGYPKQTADYYPEKITRDLVIAEKILEGMSLEDAVKHTTTNGLFKVEYRVTEKLKWTSAFLRAKNDGFGGKERSIHYGTLRNWPNGVWSMNGPFCDPEKFIPFVDKVYAKRVVKTGRYFPPHSYYDSYSGEYDYDPGGLEEMKTHVIITTSYGDFHTDDIEPVKEPNEQAR